MGEGLKMAKASQADIDAACELYQFLRAVEGGDIVSNTVAEFDYSGYDDCETDIDFVARAFSKGGLFRVVWGMGVLLDPQNEMVDPGVDYLAPHPKVAALAAENERLRAEVADLLDDGDDTVCLTPALHASAVVVWVCCAVALVVGAVVVGVAVWGWA